MITPKDMERFTENEIVNMYGELNQDLTKTIIKQLKKGGDLSTYTQSQIIALKRAGGEEVFKEALKKTDGLSAKRKKEIEKLFDDIASTEMKGYKTVFEKKGIEYKLSKEMIQTLNYAKKVGNRDLNNLTKSIAYKSKKTYIKAVDQVYKEVATGAYDYNTSIKKAVRNLASKRITLKNKAGRQEQIDVAVKRNLFTGIQQTAKSLALEVGKMIDYNCVKIGHSGSCRPSHNVIDDVVMSKKEFQKYAYLTEEPNCHHLVNFDWREEYEDKNAEAEYGEEHLTDIQVLRNYKKQQKANYYARQVRSKKNDIASGDKSKDAKIKLGLAQKKYREFCKQNKMDVDYFKTWKVGYNK